MITASLRAICKTFASIIFLNLALDFYGIACCVALLYAIALSDGVLVLLNNHRLGAVHLMVARIPPRQTGCAGPTGMRN